MPAFTLLEDHVVARYWDDEAVLRLGFERFLRPPERRMAPGRHAHLPAGPSPQAGTEFLTKAGDRKTGRRPAGHRPKKVAGDASTGPPHPVCRPVRMSRPTLLSQLPYGVIPRYEAPGRQRRRIGYDAAL